jgi:hypothetical protein
MLTCPTVAGTRSYETTANPWCQTDTGRVLQQRLEAIHAAGMPGVFAQVRDGEQTRDLTDVV